MRRESGFQKRPAGAAGRQNRARPFGRYFGRRTECLKHATTAEYPAGRVAGLREDDHRGEIGVVFKEKRRTSRAGGVRCALLTPTLFRNFPQKMPRKHP